MHRASFALCPHDDVIKLKHFPRYWPYAREIHRSLEKMNTILQATIVYAFYLNTISIECFGSSLINNHSTIISLLELT